MFTFDKTDEIHEERPKDRLTHISGRVCNAIAPVGAIVVVMGVLSLLGWIVLI